MIIDAALPRPSMVAITMPRISPIAQPVRQCRVAATAVLQPRLGACPGSWGVGLVDSMSLSPPALEASDSVKPFGTPAEDGSGWGFSAATIRRPRHARAGMLRDAAGMYGVT